MKENYLIFGMPGSGKGTFCQNLKAKGYKIIAMGDRLRRQVKSDTALGKQVKYNIDTGTLISDDLAFAIMSEDFPLNKPFAIEGFPSTINQYQMFLKFLKQMDLKITFVHLDCTEELALKRILNRMTCSGCAFIYNRVSKPSIIPNHCNFCQQELFVRNEDSEELAKKRIQTFNQKTLPILQLAKKDFPSIVKNQF